MIVGDKLLRRPSGVKISLEKSSAFFNIRATMALDVGSCKKTRPPI